MKRNIFLSETSDRVGKTIFTIFEVASIFVFVLSFILAIANAALAHSFLVFISNFISAIIYSLILFGIGKIIDMQYAKKDNKIEIEKEDE